mgnify:CR=1 FL=1
MKSIFIKTFGCTLNQRDGEDLVFGLTVAKEEKDASIIVINTCGVKEQTENKIYKYITDSILPLKNKEIIVCGCLVDINSEKLKTLLPKAKFFGIRDKTKLISYLEKYKIKPKNKLMEKHQITKAIIIANGCLGNCAYCAVKFARGKLESKSIAKIIEEVKTAVESGTKEILLTAQDTACYGLDINTNIAELLKEIIKIEGDYKIRLGMGNPQHLKKYKKEISEIFKSEKIYKFLHVPIQSGSNSVLKKMNRYYTKEEYLELIKYFKKNIKDLTLATDIIVGFPTETEKDFKETLELIKECKFDIVNISRFGQRKNIEANKYKELPGTIKKERSRSCTILCSTIALLNNKKLVGKTREILITEIGKNNTSIGRTIEYKQVVVPKKLEIGKKIKIKIKEARSGYLFASELKS